MEELEPIVEEIVELLASHKWLHQHRVTDFFKHQLYNQIPHDWRNIVTNLTLQELNSLPLGYYKEEWPVSLKCFTTKCHKLSSKRHSTQESDIKSEKDDDLHKHPGLTLKKIHEVKRLVKVVGEICETAHCHHVIDVGAGLGHLDLQLSRQFPVHVLGLEQDHAMVIKATAKACDSPRVRSVRFKLCEDSMRELKDILCAAYDEHPLLLTGLHCCGDLSISVIQSFIHIPSIQHLVLLSCCYHSMKHNDVTKETFQNFPLSQLLKKVLSQSTNQSQPTNENLPTNQSQPTNEHLPTNQSQQSYKNVQTNQSKSINQPLINVCSLRLACQQSSSSWTRQTAHEHQTHTLNVAYRGILENAVSINNISFKKHKKKLYKIQRDTTFEQYLSNIIDRTSISESQARLIVSHYKEYEQFIKFIEPFTALQVMLQPLIEHLLLVDRMAYVREHGYTCDLFNIFDDVISPRNCAIIAHKNKVPSSSSERLTF